LPLWRQKRRADELHRQIVRQVAIAAACGPAGARKVKMAEKLGEVNRGLAELCQAAGFGTVSLDQDLEVSLDRKSEIKFSGSEWWWVRLMLQLEIARRDGSAMVVIDGRKDRPAAEVLDSRGRAGLAGALIKAGVSALVVMMTDRPGADLFRKAGLGRSYWVEDGRAMPMDQAAVGRKAA
jgi:hypothetical protein